MAAISQSPTTLTPPASSHGPGYSWHISGHDPSEHVFGEGKPSVHDENVYSIHHSTPHTQNGSTALHSTSGNLEPLSRKHTNGDAGSDMKPRSLESSLPHPRDSKPHSVKDLTAAADGSSDPKKRAGDLRPESDSDDNSKWIHRDKLARIENEELQAAGIVLPRQRERTRSKSQRREHSRDGANGQGRESTTRSRKNSAVTGAEPRTPDLASSSSWDLRLPEEIAEEGDGYWISHQGTKSSRIPVAKVSPVPIPNEHLERDTLLPRKRDGSPTDDDGISYPKTRARSGSTGNALAKTVSNGTAHSNLALTNPSAAKQTNASPKKATTTAATKKPARPANGAPGKPKSRGAPSKDSTASSGGGTRPSTRSGEREFSSSKQMEGEPPWMVSAYRPDPRLPPDQQLLPTVAKRLQQEKWEREGKFGSVYDREFRPLTDEGFLRPPEPSAAAEEEMGEPREEANEETATASDWPLKPEAKSPSLPGRTNSYSTMPKISDKPTISPLPSPRAPTTPSQPQAPVRIPAPPEDPPTKKEDRSCACCIVM